MVNTRQTNTTERIRIGPKRKIAFVCSGGAAKAGAFHLGVALALQERGFRFYGGMSPANGAAKPPGPMEISSYVGSSAGSIISTFLAAGYSLENIFNSFLGRMPTEPIHLPDVTPKILPKLTYQKMFRLTSGPLQDKVGQLTMLRRIFSDFMDGSWEALVHLKWLKMTGIFSTSGIEQYMREDVLLSNRFQDYISDLFIVATQLNHSRKVVFGKYSYQPPPHDLTCQYDNDAPISEACAASTSLIPIFSPYSITHRDGSTAYYIDGEIRDTLSTHVAVDAGADLIIASYTHQPYHFPKGLGSLTDHGLPAIIIQSIYLLVEQKINNQVHNKETQKKAINAVSQYCKVEGVSEAHRKRICEILESELHHRTDVDSIYIHPKPDDGQMFFGDHFSLSPKKMAELVRSGFRAAIDVLKRYDFADHKPDHAIGTTRSGTES